VATHPEAGTAEGHYAFFNPVAAGTTSFGRLAGDEFVGRLRRVLSEPIEIPGGTLRVGASIGTAMYAAGSGVTGQPFLEVLAVHTLTDSPLELPPAVFRKRCIQHRKVAYRLWTSARQNWRRT
jgi:hypothetical protein